MTDESDLIQLHFDGFVIGIHAGVRRHVDPFTITVENDIVTIYDDGELRLAVSINLALQEGDDVFMQYMTLPVVYDVTKRRRGDEGFLDVIEMQHKCMNEPMGDATLIHQAIDDLQIAVMNMYDIVPYTVPCVAMRLGRSITLYLKDCEHKFSFPGWSDCRSVKIVDNVIEFEFSHKSVFIPISYVQGEFTVRPGVHVENSTQ